MTKKKGKPTYRYYVCTAAQKNGWDTCPSKSVPAMEAEQFVVDQLRRVSTDDGLFKEVLEKAEKQAEIRRTELQTELQGLQSHVQADLKALSLLKPQSPRYIKIREQIADAEKRIAAIAENLRAVEKENLDSVKVAAVFKNFDALWNPLLPKERVRVVRLLVDRVGYDGAKGSMAVTFRVSDLHALAQLQQERA